MIKKFFKISFYSFIAFCVFNFISLIYSIIFNKLQGSFPKYNFGFPFEFYYQFEVRSFGTCYELQHGTNINNSLYDFIIFWIIVFLYFQLKTRNFKLTTNNKQHK